MVDTVVRRVADGTPMGADANVAKVSMLSRTEQCSRHRLRVPGRLGHRLGARPDPHDDAGYLYSMRRPSMAAPRNIQLNIHRRAGLGLPR